MHIFSLHVLSFAFGHLWPMWVRALPGILDSLKSCCGFWCADQMPQRYPRGHAASRSSRLAAWLPAWLQSFHADGRRLTWAI